MTKIFENPLNGHREEISSSSPIWVLIFGMFYLIYKGLWPHVLIWFLLVVVPAGLTGGPGIILSLPIVSIAYAVGIKGIIANKFLRSGWRAVSEDALQTPPTQPPATNRQPGADLFMRKCPSCAEDIKIEAIKCRFCNTELT